MLSKVPAVSIVVPRSSPSCLWRTGSPGSYPKNTLLRPSVVLPPGRSENSRCRDLRENKWECGASTKLLKHAHAKKRQFGSSWITWGNERTRVITPRQPKQFELFWLRGPQKQVLGCWPFEAIVRKEISILQNCSQDKNKQSGPIRVGHKLIGRGINKY